MTEKYIVELKDRETLYKAAIGGNGEPYISTAMKNVYKEPNLEAIRDEAYEKGMETPLSHRACGKHPVPAPLSGEPREQFFTHKRN